MATSDFLTEKFNEEILIDLLQEVCREIDCAVSQYNLMQSKLRHITLRLDRALRTERLSSLASLELWREHTRSDVYEWRISRKETTQI